MSEILLNTGDLHLLNGNSALHYAAGIGNHHIGKLLLKAGADVDSRNSFSETPLIVAAQCGFNDFTALLIDNKADVNAVNNESRSAMDFVSERGYTEILEQLLMAGADGK
jgi:ankyrin repeat protein